MEKKKEITSFLIDIFDRIVIDTPNNFDEILEFVYEDVCETADPDNWHDGDVAIAFRRWVEEQSNKTDIIEAWDEIEETITSFNELTNEELIDCKSSILNRLNKALSLLDKYVPEQD